MFFFLDSPRVLVIELTTFICLEDFINTGWGL